MAANVLFVIIPGHWELVRAKEAGREPDPRPGILGQAALGAQQLPDAAGALHDARGALPVHVHARPRLGRARRADGRRRGDPPLLQPAPRRARRSGGSRSGAPARSPRSRSGCGRPSTKPARRSARPCRSRRRGRSSRRAARPATRCTRPSPGSSSPPAGVVLDTPEQIHALASQIKAVAVDSTFMPLGNATHMTAGRARPRSGSGSPQVRRSSRDQDRRRRLRAHRPPRGGALPAHGRVLPDDAPVREQADPGALVGPGGVDPDGRLTTSATSGPRIRPATRRRASCCSTRAASARSRSSSPTATRASRARPASSPGTTSRPSSRGSSSCRRSASSCSGRARRRSGSKSRDRPLGRGRGPCPRDRADAPDAGRPRRRDRLRPDRRRAAEDPARRALVARPRRARGGRNLLCIEGVGHPLAGRRQRPGDVRGARGRHDRPRRGDGVPHARRR